MTVQELPIPERVEGIEIVRVVLTEDDNGVHIINANMSGRAEEEPVVVWGIVIADLIKHVAGSLEGKLRAVEDDREFSRDEILEMLRKVIYAEITEGCSSIRRFTDA